MRDDGSEVFAVAQRLYTMPGVKLRAVYTRLQLEWDMKHRRIEEDNFSKCDTLPNASNSVDPDEIKASLNRSEDFLYGFLIPSLSKQGAPTVCQ
ncbi:hypothetical protein Ancab_000901 [Ancistrocladus abbreviatus]